MKHFWSLAAALVCLALPSSAQDSLRTNRMEEVVVTGTGTQHRLKDVPVQTEVITRRELEQYGGRSIEDILSGLTASFAFSEDDMGSQMQMNGLGNAYILILIDGKRLHGDNGGQNDLGLIDPARIERIEIVKGAASALYGSDAIAGVINIITRKYDRDGLLLENTTRGGSYNDWRQHNSVGHGNPDSYDTYKANVRYTELEEALQTYSKNYFVGTVDMMENFKTHVYERMQAAGITSGKVFCHPLMSIDGDHGHNDMAGDDDAWDGGFEANEEGEVEDTSWKMYFQHMGYECNDATMINKGLLELPTIRAIWMQHTQDAIAGEALDYYHSKNPEE